MEQLTIDLQLLVNQPAGIAQATLIDQLTDYIYDYYRNEVSLQWVRVTKINDEEVT